MYAPAGAIYYPRWSNRLVAVRDCNPVRKNTSLSFTSKQLSKGSAIRYADDGVSLIRSREKEQERNKMIGEDKIATSVCDVIL